MSNRQRKKPLHLIRGELKEVEDPQTKEQWQEAADLAEFYLHLDSAQRYGLVTGGPDINFDRCEEILREARQRGIRPAPDAVERIAITLGSKT
jgi:hypothetical protein